MQCDATICTSPVTPSCNPPPFGVFHAVPSAVLAPSVEAVVWRAGITTYSVFSMGPLDAVARGLVLPNITTGSVNGSVEEFDIGNPANVRIQFTVPPDTTFVRIALFATDTDPSKFSHHCN